MLVNREEIHVKLYLRLIWVYRNILMMPLNHRCSLLNKTVGFWGLCLRILQFENERWETNFFKKIICAEKEIVHNLDETYYIYLMLLVTEIGGLVQVNQALHWEKLISASRMIISLILAM